MRTYHEAKDNPISIACLLRLALILPSLLSVQQLRAEGENYWRDYAVSYPQSAYHALKSPLGWKSREWLLAGGVVAVGGLLYLTDEETNEFIQSHQSAATREFSRVFKQAGEGKYILPALAVTSAAGFLAGSEKTVDTGMLCLKSFLISNAASQALKVASQRQRPRSGMGKEFWNESGFSMKRESFPSGHTTIVWSLAPVLASQYQDQAWVAPVVYSIALMTSLSRMHDNEHWASDVFAGAVIGYLGAKLTLASTPRLTLTPDPGRRGFSFHYQF